MARVPGKWLLAASFILGISAPLWGAGCGPECGAGTIEGDDGTCTPEAVCGVGTQLVDGKCQVSEDGCGPGTFNLDGLCIPANTSCKPGTTFDSRQRICVPNLEILCGAGTEASEADARCKPRADICGPGSLPNSDGVCVVVAPACGPGTQLDAMTATCVSASVVCGAGTAFDANNGVCVPTDSVCGGGATFNANTATCTPDASCRPGDTVLNGVCTPAGQALFDSADVVESEPNDTNLNGTATTLILKPAGEQLSFAGTITPPVDLDADGTPDQDVDQFKFDATAGELLDISVQPLRGPALGFYLTSPSGETFYAPLGFSYGAQRKFIAAEDGAYTITVAPVSFLDKTVTRLGDDAWGYVGVIKREALPTPSVVDMSMGEQLTGEFTDLTDNFYQITGLGGGNAVRLTPTTFGSDVKSAAAHVFEKDLAYVGTYPINTSGASDLPLPASGELYVFMDWREVTGADTGYTFSLAESFAEVEPNDSKMTATSVGFAQALDATSKLGDKDYYQFTLAQDMMPGEGLSIQITPSSTSTLPDYNCRLLSTDAMNDEVLTALRREKGCAFWTGGLPAGTYYVEVEIGYSSNSYDYTFQIDRVTGDLYDDEYHGNASLMMPQDLGTPALPKKIYGAIGVANSVADEDYFKFSLASAVPAGQELYVEIRQNGFQTTGTMGLDLYDSAQAQINTSARSKTITVPAAAAGDYYLKVSRSSTSSFYDGLYLIDIKIQ